MRIESCSMFVVQMVVGGIFCACCAGVTASEAGTYLDALQATVRHTNTKLAAISESAAQAAREFVAGGNLYAAGSQPDFVAEACGRAGGLMAITALGRQVPTNYDVILCGFRGQDRRDELNALRQWRQSRATVVNFSSPAGLFKNRVPLDSVANVVELWTWTGEFVAACTRLGKMPVLYQSYGLPGGPERGKKYQGKRFHDDVTIAPIAQGVLGREYLGQLENMLSQLKDSQMPKLRQAANWWRATTNSAQTTTTLVTGHMFPAHGQDPRIPQLTQFVPVPAWENKELIDLSHPRSLVIYVGYQFAPGKLLEQAQASGTKLVYFDAQRHEPPEPAPNILYIAPGWPMTDACVTVPGYDIPILPASGVIQAAIFWTIVTTD